MEVVWWYLMLRWLARLLRAGDAESAGDEMDRDLDEAIEGLKGCCGTGCVIYLLVLAGAAIWYVLSDIVGWLFGGR